MDCRLEREGFDRTGTGRWHFEFFNGKREIVVIRIVYQEAVENFFLYAFGIVAIRYKWTGGSYFDVALFDAGALGEFVAIRFQMIDDNAPFSFNIHRAQRLDVGSRARAQIGLLRELVQLLNGQCSVDDNVLVHGLHLLVMIIKCLLCFSEGVIGILEAPSLRRVLGAFRDISAVLIRCLRVITGRLVRTCAMAVNSISGE